MTTLYLRQFDAFCNPSAQYCMTCLTWDPMGEIQGGPIVLLPIMILDTQRVSSHFDTNKDLI